MGAQLLTCGFDEISDLALLKLDGSNFPYAVLGNSDDLIIGEWVIAAPKEDVISQYGGGIPFAHRIDLENPIITNSSRPVEIDSYKMKIPFPWIKAPTDFLSKMTVLGQKVILQYLNLETIKM